MATFQALLRVIRALWNIAAPALRWTIRLVLLAILIWPFVVLAVAYAGMAWVTATVAMVPLVAFFILLLIFPLIAGTLAAISRARVIYKWLLLVVFGEMLIGLYLTFVPAWNDPELIGVLILLGSTLGVFLTLRWMFGWQNRWAARFAAVLTLGIVMITVIFFFGGRERVRQMPGRAVQAVSQVQIPGVQVQPQPGREIVRAKLLGDETVSEEFLRPGMVPAGWNYYFEGSPEAKVYYDDGTVGPITKWYGIKGGIRRFSGPKGQEVIVRAYPPG
ncbi:MAG: hypothetical protein G01um10142_26 [Parcubacteria group bacterium Gr01-1014_2]|nr:MAG: hypothetical protein G01um10142_26 [Parcubacteria group bacterium Gr01-1014_2]